MKKVQFINLKNGKRYEGYLANTFIERSLGLMGKFELPKGLDFLLIKPCNSIHTFFMRFPIDVIFVSKKNKIVQIKKNIVPWRITPIYFRANYVLEFKAGTITNININDEVEIVCLN